MTTPTAPTLIAAKLCQLHNCDPSGKPRLNSEMTFCDIAEFELREMLHEAHGLGYGKWTVDELLHSRSFDTPDQVGAA